MDDILEIMELMNDHVEKRIFIEYFPEGFMLSVMKDEEYCVLIRNAYMVDIINLLQKLNNEYTNLIIDIGGYERLLFQELKNRHLKYTYTKPTSDDIRHMSYNRFTLIGLYFNSRKMIYNNKLVEHLL